MKKLILAVVCLLMVNVSFAQKELLEIIKSELNREFTLYKEVENPPYYIDYRLDDYDSDYISSQFGKTVVRDNGEARYLTVNVRIGDYYRDNTHIFKNGEMYDGNYGNFTALPLGLNEKAIKQEIWLATGSSYLSAKDQYERYLNMKEELSEMEEDDSPDFTKEEAVIHFDTGEVEELSETQLDALEEMFNRLTKTFNDYPHIKDAEIDFSRSRSTKMFVSTEGSEILQSTVIYRIGINSDVVTENNNIIPLYKSFQAFQFDGLPKEEELKKEIDEMIEKLYAMRVAPEANAFSGPAILSPRVAGVFFHEIFGHRVEGNRLNKKTDSQTFKDKLNSNVLPRFMNVYSDPTLDKYQGTDLMGHYQFDDQGIVANRVSLVKEGKLHTFLLDRTPLLDFEHSNGHGRASIGMKASSRQSNLMIDSEKKVSDDELRKLLRKECKKRKLEYGYYIADVEGGYTYTNRFTPNSFSIRPTEVYKVYADGRPDELVVGVDLIGTPLTMFSEISAVGQEMGIFNGYCGAESGYVPVAAVAPALFIRKIETQKRFKFNYVESILQRP